MTFINGDFTTIWLPVPAWAASKPLVYLCATISLTTGVGLFFARTATVAARVLFAVFMAWLVVLRLPYLFLTPAVLVAWTFGETAVMVAGAWVLYSWLAGEWDKQRLGFFVSSKGVRVAQVLCGLSLIPFGLAHFLYLQPTVVLIPDWLPWHTGFAYFTGAAFIAAGLAMVTGVLGRLGATLTTVQMGVFIAVIWVPRVATGNVSLFQWGEFVASYSLLSAMWLLSESYRGVPWFAVGKRA